MEEDPSKVGSSAVGSSARSRMTADYDRDEDNGTGKATDMLDAEAGRQDINAPDDTSDSDNAVGPPSLAEHSEWNDDDGPDGMTPPGGQGTALCENAAPGLGRSKRKPAPNVNGGETNLRRNWQA